MKIKCEYCFKENNTKEKRIINKAIENKYISINDHIFNGHKVYLTKNILCSECKKLIILERKMIFNNGLIFINEINDFIN